MKGAGGYIVVGGDSLVGGELFRVIEKSGQPAFGTTRRQASVGGPRVFLDFESDAPFRAPQGVDYAFLVGAATNYERCETDPAAWRINVESIPRLAASLLEQGIFVTFISTNSVFGGERPWPQEDDAHAPGIAYARHKAEGEKAIRAAAERLKAADRLNIVRLTKILGPQTSPLPGWFAAWKRGEAVQPFTDLVFAPMSVRFAAESLATIGEKRVPGNLHLSGTENVSYLDFAKALAAEAGVDPKLITPTTAVEKGVHILFKPRYSGIGMRRTSALTGLQPQPLEDVARYLVRERRTAEEK